VAGSVATDVAGRTTSVAGSSTRMERRQSSRNAHVALAGAEPTVRHRTARRAVRGAVQEPGQRGERPPRLRPTLTGAPCAPTAVRRPGSLSRSPRHVTGSTNGKAPGATDSVSVSDTDPIRSRVTRAAVKARRCAPPDDTARSTKETVESVTMSAKASVIPTDTERAFVRARARQAARAIFEAERSSVATLAPVRD
jgi:hypothetical protein